MTTTSLPLVDLRAGLLNRKIFTDSDLYKQELEQIFGRMWLFVAHESQVAKPNDFTANYMGEDPVLVTRDSRGKLHTFLNMCRHRGNRICRADAGNAPSFMCTYHGWTFATDGKLVGVPGYKEAYFEELDRTQWGLVEAKTESYKGLIFATWDQLAPSLYDYLGDATWYLDILLDRRDGGSEVLGGAHKLVLPVNWKFGADNFGGDNHHVPISHGSTRVARPDSQQQQRPQPMNSNPDRHNVYAGNGHCIIGGYSGATQNAGDVTSSPEASVYFKEHLDELYKRLGPERGRQTAMGIATMFPNFTWFASSGVMIRNWHPRAPEKTEAYTWCLVDKQAPEEIRQALRRRLTLCFSPSGLFEQDDMDNFGQSTQSGRSRIGRQYPVNMQMGMGKDHKHESIPGTLSPSISENNARYFYGRWAEVMEAPSWNQISISPRTK